MVDSGFCVQCVLIMLNRYSLQSLKCLGTVGEPINPEAWLWYYNVIGHKQCAVVDTFWQTETVSKGNSCVYYTCVHVDLSRHKLLL